MVVAMQCAQVGGPEMLQPVEVTLPAPGPNQIRLRHTAIGLNYIDVYHRSGLYPLPLPATPGMEAAGVVEAVGASVTGLKPGDRVAYGRGPVGAYAQARVIAAQECILLPDAVSDSIAASAMLKGLTAWYLLHETFPVAKGDTLLVHAAAGGVGQLLVQWAKQLDARVIATAGSAAKADIARQCGADAVILYRQEDVAARVRSLTDGRGVDVVYDAVGQSTFMGSLDSLKPKGMMVSYGQASGPIPPMELSELGKRGSLYLTRPSLMDYMRDEATYQKAARVLLAKLADGSLRVAAPTPYPLTEAAAAHTALEARQTTGSVILLP